MVAELEKKPGNSAHAAAGHADEMNVMSFLRQKFCQVDISRGHDWVYFSMVAATRLAASRGANRPAASDIRRSCSGSSIISRIFRVSNSGVSSDSFKTNAAPARAKISALRVW